MQVKPQQLKAQLSKPLASIYIVSGDEPLIVQEARDAIVKASKKQGFEDHKKLSVETGFHWQEILDASQNLSLFSSKTFIELKNPSGKFDTTATKVLITYCEQAHPDTCLLILSGKLTPAQQKAAWMKKIDSTGAVVTVWPVKSHELPAWISQRSKSLNLKLTQNNIQLIAQLTEGNLLATNQSLEKLAIIYPSEDLNETKIMTALCNNARYNVFDLMDPVLLGDYPKAMRILTGLQQEGVEPILVLWAITRELNILLPILQQVAIGKPLAQLLSKVWASKKVVTQRAAQRLKLKTLQTLLSESIEVDKIIKGQAKGKAWDAISRIILKFSGINLPEYQHA